MSLLSIIIPVYNVERFLKKCLDSVIITDTKDYEIIAVNDGSTDSSPDILNEYEKKYPEKLTVISTKNQGLGAARNTGIKAASGKYIVFLDSDDFLAENAVAEIVSACRDDFDICIFDFVSITESGKVIKSIRGLNRYFSPFSLDINPTVIFELPSATNKIYRLGLFTENNIFYPNRVWFEDLRTTPKLYLYAKKIIYKNKGWYFYLQQSQSITHSTNIERNLEILDAVNDTISYYKEKNSFDKYYSEIEYAVFYNVFLTSVDRVNLIDSKNVVQDKLAYFFLKNFPDHKKNKYIKKMKIKYKIIYYLIFHRYYKELNFLLTINNKLKGKE